MAAGAFDGHKIGRISWETQLRGSVDCKRWEVGWSGAEAKEARLDKSISGARFLAPFFAQLRGLGES